MRKIVKSTLNLLVPTFAKRAVKEKNILIAVLNIIPKRITDMILPSIGDILFTMESIGISSAATVSIFEKMAKLLKMINAPRPSPPTRPPSVAVLIFFSAPPITNVIEAPNAILKDT